MFDKPIEIYDIEIAPNFFSYTGINANVDIKAITKLIKANHGTPYPTILRQNNIPFTQFVISEKQNDFTKVIKYFNRDVIFVGFNNHGYDDLIIKYLMLIAMYKFMPPSIVQGKKIYLRNSAGQLSVKQMPLFKDSGLLKTNPKTGRQTVSTKALLTTIYMMSQYIINLPFEDRFRDKIIRSLTNMKVKFSSIDLFTMMEQPEKKSLKMWAIMLKWLRIQDLPYKFDDKITPDMVDAVLDYNLNDVLITLLGYVNRGKDLKLRKGMMDKDGFDFSIMSLSKSNIASLYIQTDYARLAKTPVHKFKGLRTKRQFIPIDDCISDRVAFRDTVTVNIDEMVKLNPKLSKKTPRRLFTNCKLSDFLDFLKAKTITNTSQLDFVIHFPTVSFNFKSGGLHSVDDPRILKSIPNVIYYKDFDFGSYYPGFVIGEYVAPAHLDADVFHELAVTYTNNRLNYKAEVKRLEKLGHKDPSVFKSIEYEDANTGAKSLKIVINSGLFGKFGSEDSFLNDLQALLTVTINGQLILLMLAEEYTENGLKVVNANTDGLICEIKHEQLENYYKIGAEFGKKVDIPYEYTDYAVYANRDINNYVAIKQGAENMNYEEAVADESIKQKGAFVDQIDPAKGYMHPIVPRAVNKYLIDGTPVEDTIINHGIDDPDAIMDFCFSQKIDANKFHMELIKPTGERETIQKNVRAYVGQKRVGNAPFGQLFKAYNDPPVKESFGKRGRKVKVKTGEFLMEHRQLTIFNDWFPVESIKDYHIDYRYYIGKAKELIVIIENGIKSKNRNRDLKKTISNQNQGTLWDD